MLCEDGKEVRDFRRKSSYMNRKSVLKDFVKYVSLNIFGQMAYSCYTLADTFFVSASLGANGLTALNLAFLCFAC